MNKKLLGILIVLLTLVGSVLRFGNITKNPPGLNIDEVSYGYSAYSILKTGKDENGNFMPITFRSIGDYKSPLLIYSLVPSIAIFGLNEFGVRFTTALLGSLSIPAFFLLVLSLVNNKKIALLSAVLLTISPWHIYYSRYASESLMGVFFLILGMWLFQNIKKGKIWVLFSSLTLVLSFYSYHSLRLFIPVFIASSVFLSVKSKKARIKDLIIFTVLSSVFALPMLYSMIFGASNTRAGMVFLSQDIDYTRYVILDHVQQFGENFLLFFFWIKRYLNYFQPDFLFLNGLSMTANGTLGLGVLYLYELPWLILGVTELIKKRIENKGLIVFWILLGILPASLTNNEQSTVRSLVVLPMLLLIVSFGVVSFLKIINHFKNKYLKWSLIGVIVIFTGITLVQAFLVFAVHFPLQRGEAFMEGTKESVIYALNNRDNYQEIVFDPYRGIEAPYIVNIPFMYILFYSKYDPNYYQQETKRFGQDLFGFSKFTIRRIDWRSDRNKKGTLFVGSPWSLPEKDLKKENILKEIYLSNGSLALLIVTP